MYEDRIVDLLGWRRAKIGTGPRIQFRRAPRGQRKQGDGRCCLALHVTIPLNRNFQSWRWGFLLLPPSTVHTRLCASIFDGQCHFSRKLHQNHARTSAKCIVRRAPAPPVECASSGVSCLVDKLRFIECEVAACLPFTSTWPRTKSCIVQFSTWLRTSADDSIVATGRSVI